MHVKTHATADRMEDRLMARLNLKKFDIAMDSEAFKDLLSDVFSGHYRGITTVDELLVRPREAIRFCDHVRDALDRRGEDAAYDLPDDTILRTLLNIRKRG